MLRRVGRSIIRSLNAVTEACVLTRARTCYDALECGPVILYYIDTFIYYIDTFRRRHITDVRKRLY